VVARLAGRAAGQSPQLAVAANNGAGGGSDRVVGRLARRGRGGST
jgi:hypothetical protein